MNKKMIALSMAGFLMGFSVGIAGGLYMFGDYIHDYTDTCVEQFDVCVQQLEKYDPMIIHNPPFNLTLEGYE